MPSNAESFANSYVNSVEASWNREREEAKSLLVREEGNRAAYISSLEQSIRAADDDIRNWTNLQGTADRAERKLILERQRLSLSRAKSRRRGLRSGSVAGQAFDKLETKFAKAATGKGEKSLNLAGAMSRMGGRSKQDQALALISILQNETDLAGLIATSGTGAKGTAGIESSVAGGSGILRTLEERNARGAGLGVDREVLQMAAAGMVGLWGAGVADQHQLLDPAMAAQMRGAVTQRANAAVASASSGGEDKALADELERSGFLLEDFLPVMEASGLIQRREDLERRLAEERAARQPDLEAETERRFLERVGDSGIGEGLPFAGRGLIGAFQFMGEGRRQQQELEAETAALAAEQAEFDAMTPNERLLLRTTGQAMASFQKHGANIPPGVSEDLWALATQIANQSKAGGFASRDDIVVQARALVGQLDSTKNMSPEERENALEQTLEFYSMQKMGDFPPPVSPVEEVVDEVTQAVEDADPDERRSNASSRAANTGRKRQREADETATAARERQQTKKTAGMLGLSPRDLRFIANLGMERGSQFMETAPEAYDRRSLGASLKKSLSPRRIMMGPLGAIDAMTVRVAPSELKESNMARAKELQRRGYNPQLIREAANKASVMSFPWRPDGIKEEDVPAYEAAAREHAYTAMLDMIEQQRGAESLSLPRYLEANPRAANAAMGAYRGSEEGVAVLDASQGMGGPLVRTALGVVDEFVPAPFIPEAEELLYSGEGGSAITTTDEWDELLDQLAKRQGTQADEDRSLEATLSAVEGI